MNGAERKQHVVLCEGYDDRSFWRGWLLRLGCRDPSEGGKKPINDTWGRPVRGGRFLFYTPAGSDIVVQPFHGRARAREAVREYLGNLQPYRVSRVILNLDDDTESIAGSTHVGADELCDSIARDLNGVGDQEKGWDIEGSLLVPVIWRCDDPDPTRGLPSKQTLERLLAAAIRAAAPSRADAVEEWLNAEPSGRKLPKSYAYSYFAKWYIDRGAGHFYECLWQDPAVARELQQRLQSVGAWKIVEDMVDD